MIRAILARPVGVLMVFASLGVLGILAVVRLPLAFLPGVDIPVIYVWIPYHDVLPSEVERRIVVPVEESLATLPSVEKLTARAASEGATFVLEFDWGRPIDMLRMEVREKLDRVRAELPADVRDIFVYSYNAGTDIPVLEVRLSSRGPSLAGSHDLLQSRIVRPLERVNGVARVELYGVSRPEVRVDLNLDRLRAHRVDLPDLVRRIEAATGHVALGRIEESGRRMTVRVVSPVRSAADLRMLPVTAAGVRLGEVARVEEVEPAEGAGRHLNRSDAVGLAIHKESSANTVAVVRRARAVLERIQADPALEGIDLVTWHDQSEEITGAITGLRSAGAWGALLAVLVLYLFLRRLDATLLVAASIPFSLVIACLVLYFTGHSLNVLVMMGLMLGVGLLVDNSVVVMESIGRFLGEGVPPREAAERGTRHVWLAVFASTATSLIIFLPFVFGPTDDLSVWLSEVAIALTLTISASLLVSLTLIPLVASRLSLSPGAPRSLGFFDRATGAYRRALIATLRHRWIAAGAVAVLAVLLVAPFRWFGLESDAGRELSLGFLGIDYEIHDNLSKDRVEEVVDRVEAWIYGQRDWLPFESCYSYFTDGEAVTRLDLPRAEMGETAWQALKDTLDARLPDLPGVELHVMEFGMEDEEGAEDEFYLYLWGDDAAVLERLAETARRQLAAIPGLADVRVVEARAGEEVQVRLDRPAAARSGLTARSVLEIFGFTLRGTYLRRLRGEEGELDVLVSLDPGSRSGLAALGALPVGVGEDGRAVPLESVARFERARGPTTIRRVDRRTSVALTGRFRATQAGKPARFEDYAGPIRRVMDRLQATVFPVGYGWSFSDRVSQEQEEMQAMVQNTAGAVVLVYLVMAALFESLLFPFVILFSILFAGVGVFWFLLATGTPFGIMASIGCFLLVGIVVNNGIILVDHINARRRRGEKLEVAVVEGGVERLRPILMTALTTILGMVPLAVGRSAVGSAFYFPLARAVIGGLAASTVFTLLLVPYLYVVAEGARRAARRIGRRSRLADPFRPPSAPPVPPRVGADRTATTTAG